MTHRTEYIISLVDQVTGPAQRATRSLETLSRGLASIGARGGSYTARPTAAGPIGVGGVVGTTGAILRGEGRTYRARLKLPKGYRAEEWLGMPGGIMMRGPGGQLRSPKDFWDVREIKETTKAKENLAKSTAKLASRAAIVIPIWMLLRNVFMGVIRTVTNTIRVWMDLEREMGRVATVTRGNQEQFNLLKQTIIAYTATSTRSFKEAASVMYALGSAGLNVQEQLAGMKHIMNLTIGTFGNAEQAAKLVAGAYNVFGKSIEGVYTVSAKFKKIADILAYTYSTQQVELSEVATAMTYVGSVGSLLNISFGDLVGTIGFLNTGMLKGCYDKETEILTDQGWKYFKDLNKTEKVATLNPETKEIEYQLPIEYINSPYKGKMYRIKNRFIDLKVTPNHNMFVRMGRKSCKTRKYKMIRADEVFGKHQTFLRSGKWKGKNQQYFYLPSVTYNYGGFKHENKKIKIKMKVWLKFLAYYLSEGCCSVCKDKRKATSYKVRIFQSEGKKKKIMKKVLNQLPFKVFDCKNGFLINNKSLCIYLKQFGKSYEKFIPDFIKILSPKLIKTFIEAYNLGDGKERNLEITTSSIKMRNDLQELALKAGYTSVYYRGEEKNTEKIIKGNKCIINNDTWVVCFSNRTEISFCQKNNLSNNRGYNHTTIEEWQEYEGNQYCVEVEKYHTLFVRRKGKTVWCGNTRAGTSLMNAFIQLAQQSDRLGDLGVVFDPSLPMNFRDIMQQLADIYGEQTISLHDLRKIMDVFGRRGGRAVALIIQRFNEWKETLSGTEADFEGFAEYMRNMAENTLPMAFKKLGNAIAANVISRLEKIEPLMKGLQRLADYIEAVRLIKEYPEYFPPELREPPMGVMPYRAILEWWEQREEMALATEEELRKLEGINRERDISVNYDKEINRVIKEHNDGLKKEVDARAEIEKYYLHAVGFEKYVSEEGQRQLKNLLDMLEITDERKKAGFELHITEKRALRTLQEQLKYNIMRAKGLEDYRISYQRLDDLVDKYNEKIKEYNEKHKSDQIDYIELQDVLLGKYNDLFIASRHVGEGWKKHVIPIIKQADTLTLDLIKNTQQYADELKSAFEEALTALIKGESTLVDFFAKLGTTWREAQLKEIVKGISKQFFDVTGIGNLFGLQMKDIKRAFMTPAELMENSILSASREGSRMYYNAIRKADIESKGGVWYGGATYGGGLGGGLVGGYGIPGFGAGGFWNRQIGWGAKYPVIHAMGPSGEVIRGGGPTYGQILGLGMATTTAISGAGGLGTATGLMGGVGTAMLGLANMGFGQGIPMMGAAPGVGPSIGGSLGWLGPVGLALTLGSFLFGMFDGGTPSWTREEIREQTSQIGSRIDITNRQLEWVNRNLVALRSELTYIMQRSYYFRERSTITDEFAIDGLRGVT